MATKEKTLSKKVVGLLRQDMQKGVYPPGSFLKSIRRMCKEYNVSHVTVGSALSELEKEGLIERYHRRGIVVKAKASYNVFKTGKKAIGKMLFVRWDTSPAYTEFFHGVQKYCKEMDLELEVVDSLRSHERLLAFIENLPEDVKGLILIPSETPQYGAAIKAVIAKGIGVVCLDNKIPEGADCCNVSGDDYNCGYVAASHLLELAHAPVHFIGYHDHDHPTSIKQRFRGWVSAMEHYGFPAYQSYYHKIPATEDSLVSLPIQRCWELSGAIAKEILLSRPAEGFSFFTCNDHFARGVYIAADECDLKIGKDVRVVGVGDYPYAARMKPALSSIFYSRVEVGYAGAEVLHRIMLNPDSSLVHKIIPVKLMARSSSTGKDI